MLRQNLHFVWQLMRANFVLLVQVNLLLIFANVEIPLTNSIAQAADRLISLGNMTCCEQHRNHMLALFHQYR